jgi:hypothetical protein
VKVTFAHICDYAIIARDGKLSVLGIFQGIATPAVPTVHPSMFLAFEVELNYAEAKQGGALRIEIVDQDGAKIIGVAADIKFDGQAGIGINPRIGQVIGFQQLLFPRFGPYNVNFFCDDKLSLQQEFQVSKITQPPFPKRPQP